MRKFVSDYDKIYTESELKEFFENVCDDYDGNFYAYLEDCMYYNNGTLTEILTADTPKGRENKTVSFCRVIWLTSEDIASGENVEDNTTMEWLSANDQKHLVSCGYSVTIENV